jgi:hypothetical protein
LAGDDYGRTGLQSHRTRNLQTLTTRHRRRDRWSAVGEGRLDKLHAGQGHGDITVLWVVHNVDGTGALEEHGGSFILEVQQALFTGLEVRVESGVQRERSSVCAVELSLQLPCATDVLGKERVRREGLEVVRDLNGATGRRRRHTLISSVTALRTRETCSALALTAIVSTDLTGTIWDAGVRAGVVRAGVIRARVVRAGVVGAGVVRAGVIRATVWKGVGIAINGGVAVRTGIYGWDQSASTSRQDQGAKRQTNHTYANHHAFSIAGPLQPNTAETATYRGGRCR